MAPPGNDITTTTHELQATYHAKMRDAVWDDDQDAIDQLLKSPHFNIHYTDAGLQTILHLSAFWGKPSSVRKFIQAGANVGAKNTTSNTALDLAIQWGHSDIANTLRFQGALSVWEERFQHCQVRLENEQHEREMRQHEFERQAHRIQGLEAQLLAKHRAALAVSSTLERTQSQLDASTQKNAELNLELEQALARNQELADQASTLVHAETKARYAAMTARDERDVALANDARRQETLAEMTQAEATSRHHWHRAEVAAQVADTCRNQAFVARDNALRKLEASVAETTRLNDLWADCRERLEVLENETRDYIREKKRAQLRMQRAQVQMQVLVDETSAANTSAKAELGKRRQSERKQRQLQRQHQHVKAEHAFAQMTIQEQQQELRGFQKEFIQTVRKFAHLRESRWTSSSSGSGIMEESPPKEGVALPRAQTALTSSSPIRRKSSIQIQLQNNISSSSSVKRKEGGIAQGSPIPQQRPNTISSTLSSPSSRRLPTLL